MSGDEAAPRRFSDRVQVKTYVDRTTFERLFLLLADPTTGRIPNGALSRLTERLYLEELRRQASRIASRAGAIVPKEEL